MTIAPFPSQLGRPARSIKATGVRWLCRARTLLGSLFTDTRLSEIARNGTAYWNVESAVLMATAAAEHGEWSLVESELTSGGRLAMNDARCVNLLGLAAECRGDWPLARKMYSRSARLDPSYLPARLNMRRYFELFMFGRSTVPLCWE